MKYKLFTGQGADLEKKLNEWLTPNTELLHVAQSTISAMVGDKNVPYTILSVFYNERGIVEQRNLDIGQDEIEDRAAPEGRRRLQRRVAALLRHPAASQVAFDRRRVRPAAQQRDQPGRPGSPVGVPVTREVRPSAQAGGDRPALGGREIARPVLEGTDDPLQTLGVAARRGNLDVVLEEVAVARLQFRLEMVDLPRLELPVQLSGRHRPVHGGPRERRDDALGSLQCRMVDLGRRADGLFAHGEPGLRHRWLWRDANGDGLADIDIHTLFERRDAHQS